VVVVNSAASFQTVLLEDTRIRILEDSRHLRTSPKRSRIYGDVLVPAPSVKKDEEDERIRIVHTLKRVQSFLILFRGKSSLKIYTENWDVLIIMTD
jgi:hypothetical protein